LDQPRLLYTPTISWFVGDEKDKSAFPEYVDDWQTNTGHNVKTAQRWHDTIRHTRPTVDFDSQWILLITKVRTE